MMHKHSICDLAILGGLPAFDRRICVGRPNVGDREDFFERVRGVFDRGCLSNHGPCVDELEARIAAMTGVKHCIVMANATIALQVTARALDLSGEVIVPAFTFVATAHALRWQGITPVFCDIDLQTHNLDPARVRERITPRTTGIVGVHLWGRPCDTGALTAIAREHRLALMFDAAHAFGCSHQGRMIGNFGDAEVFSFHATKFFNTLEGGAVLTNNSPLADRLRLMRNFGLSGPDTGLCLGTNAKLNEVSAAMGLANLDSLDDFLAANRRNHEAYRRGLANLPGVRLAGYSQQERCNYQYVVALIDEAVAGISRDGLIEILAAENVVARRYFYPGCHRMEPYRSESALRDFPNSDQLGREVLTLPTGIAIGPGEIETICDILRLALCHPSEIRRRLQEPEFKLELAIEAAIT
jgi:dTDP-4-amino-4,6-dideoxygalactose transaminase